MNTRQMKLLVGSLVLGLVIVFALMPVSNVAAYYGSTYGGYYGTYGGTYGTYGGGYGFVSVGLRTHYPSPEQPSHHRC